MNTFLLNIALAYRTARKILASLKPEDELGK